MKYMENRLKQNDLKTTLDIPFTFKYLIPKHIALWA